MSQLARSFKQKTELNNYKKIRDVFDNLISFETKLFDLHCQSQSKSKSLSVD